MQFLKFIGGMILSIVAFIIAMKILGFLLGLIGIVLHLIWAALVIGFFVLIVWALYKLISPSRASAI